MLALGARFKDAVNTDDGIKIPEKCLKKSYRDDSRRLEDEDSEERLLTGKTQLSGFGVDHEHHDFLTTSRGFIKGGKKAVCTVCSWCTKENLPRSSQLWCNSKCDTYGPYVEAGLHMLALGARFKDAVNTDDGIKIPEKCLKKSYRDDSRRLEDEDESEAL